MVGSLVPEVPFETARRGYAVGATVLEAILPAHEGPAAVVPVSLSDTGLETRDGIEAKNAILDGLRTALEIIGEHDPERIVTLGGECSVSVAPFSALAHRYGEDLAVLWIDSHPDVGTGTSQYTGYHAMAVSTLTGHGDLEVHDLLPATVTADRVALVGLHEWTEDDFPHVQEWGLASFAPDRLREHSEALLQWLAGTGCSRVAIHLDVDVVDSTEMTLGAGAVPDGLSSVQVSRIIADVSAAAEVVGLTVAEYVPRQVLQLRQMLSGMPLVDD